jgi:hypothetical protein
MHVKSLTKPVCYYIEAGGGFFLSIQGTSFETTQRMAHMAL